jgi:hypothetical protein
MTLIKRADKGQALTYEELDGNFTHLGGDGSYQFPATDGLASQVLTTDGNGNLSFQTINLDEIRGDIKGSVFADDSTKLVDGVEGKIVGPVESTTGSIETLKVDQISSTTQSYGVIEINDILKLKWTNEFTSLPESSSGTYTVSYGGDAITRHSNILGNFELNYINVPLLADDSSALIDRTFTVAHILEQGATPYMINGFQINSISQTILWQGGFLPLGTANGIDIVSFTAYYDYDNEVWKILGSASSYS